LSRPRHRSNPPPAGEAVRGERLQKLLAAAGLGSRREIETWIAQGRVSIAGRAARLGDRATPEDVIFLDGKPVQGATRAAVLPRVLLYHKPVGEIVTRSDPRGRPTVFTRLPPLATGKWTSVGRLDVNTSGLLVLTDSGQLANRLMHPRYGIEREYLVRALGRLGAAEQHALLTGVTLDDGLAAFATLERADADKSDAAANRWYRVGLREGRKREVRRMFEAVGLRVSRLVRTRFGPLELPRDLPSGHARELAPGAVRALMQRLGLAR